MVIGPVCQIRDQKRTTTVIRILLKIVEQMSVWSLKGKNDYN